MCRTHDGMGIVRVTKPEFFHNDAEREAAISFYEDSYRPTEH
jgi:hypothetical protein